MQAYSDSLDTYCQKNYKEFLYYGDEYTTYKGFCDFTAKTYIPSNSSWGTPLTITTSWTKEQAKKIMKSYTEDWFKEVSDVHFVVYAVWCPNGTGINSYGQDSWEIYWLY